jgi:hypothetical protein
MKDSINEVSDFDSLEYLRSYEDLQLFDRFLALENSTICLIRKQKEMKARLLYF